MASTTNGGWAVVGSKKSSKPQPKGPLTKAKKKAFADTMPKISPILPVKESPTIYDAFIEEEERQERKMETEKEGKAGLGGGKKQVGPGGKKLGPDRKREPPTLENTIPELEEEELRKILDTTKKSFPVNPDIWLKDLASALNLFLDKIPDAGPVFDGKPFDYPMSLLPSDVHDLLLETISDAQQMSPSTLESSLEYCIDTILNDLNKGSSSHGCRLFVQLMLFHRPDTAIKSLDKYLALMQKSQSRPLRSLSIMWVIGQAGQSSLANGLKVWLTLMLPTLSVRNLASYSVDYLDNLFRIHDDLKTGFGVMSRADFFKIFSEIYGDQTNLPSDLQKRLHLLYPKIKAVAWGDVSTNLHNFFHPFLTRCKPECNDGKKFEVLNCLVRCLSTDIQSFSVWRQSYNKCMLESSILLKHLSVHLDDFKDINRKMLRETVRAFHLTNEELASDQQMVRRPEYHDAVTSCKELLTKLNRIRFPWKSIFLLIVFVFAVAFGADVMTSKSVHDSRTVRFLEEAGILYFLQHAWNRVCIYSSKIWLWLEDNVPDHVTKLWQIISPYCFLFWEKVVTVAAYVSEVSKPHRQWLMNKLDDNLPVVLEFIGRHVSTALLWTFDMAALLWDIIVYYFMAVTEWLLQNVFTGSLHPENILETFSSVLLSIKTFLSAAFEWIYNQFDSK